jgi:hypothetical protein
MLSLSAGSLIMKVLISMVLSSYKSSSLFILSTLTSVRSLLYLVLSSLVSFSLCKYFFWTMADYFTRYLMGDTTERSVNIEEMNREIEQSGTKASPAAASGRRGPEEQ